MSSLNYFFPSNQAKSTHENPLTRAFLTLLRLSPSCRERFYDQVQTTSQPLIGSEDFPRLYQLNDSYADAGYQVSKLDEFPSNFYVSLLITDNVSKLERHKVENREQEKVHLDGVIRFGEAVTLVIENKPKSTDVHFDQLDLKLKEIPDQKYGEYVVAIEWPNIFRWMGNLLKLRSTTESEALLIKDFLEFVRHSHKHLQPFDRLSLCDENRELIESRCQQLLEEIALKPEFVKEHHGWAWIIATNDPKSVKEIGLPFDPQRKALDLWIEFASTLPVARNFYGQNAKCPKKPDDPGWTLKPNLRINSAWGGWIRAIKLNSDSGDYFNFWKKNKAFISQIDSKKGLFSMLEKISGELQIPQDEITSLTTFFEASGYTRFNLVPALLLMRSISLADATTLDDKKEFKNWLKDSIKDGYPPLQKFVKN